MAKKTTQKEITSEQKVWAAVGYVWILSLLVLAARKNNDFIRGHANQGALLFVASVVFMLMPPLNIFVVLIAVVGIVKALQGEEWSIPVIGEIAKKFGDWVIKTIKL